jgi:hypothetical protein
MIRRGTQSTIITSFGVIGIISCFLPWISQVKEDVILGFTFHRHQGPVKSAITLSGTSSGHIYIAFLAIMILCVLVGIIYGLTGFHSGDAILKVLGIFGMVGAVGSAWDLYRSSSGTRDFIFVHIASLKIGFWLALITSAAIIFVSLIPVRKEQG